MNIIQLTALLMIAGVVLALIGDLLGFLCDGPDNRD